MNTSSMLVGYTAILPPFTPLDPDLWFCRIENIFVCAGITNDQIKYSCVVSNLEPKYLEDVRDLIMDPPEKEKYSKLKMELKQLYKATQQEDLIKKLENEEMGYRTPTQFLQHLRNLVGISIPDEFVKIFWLKRLPSSTQKVLASQKDLSLDRVAELADAITDLASTDTAVQDITTKLCNISSEMTSVLKMIQMGYEELLLQKQNTCLQEISKLSLKVEDST